RVLGRCLNTRTTGEVGAADGQAEAPTAPPETGANTPSVFFDTLESYEHHYNTLHTNVCSSCKRAFPSGRLLDIHILEWHDSLFQIMAEKQDMYQCLTEGCVEKFKSSKERKDHLVRVHLYPSDFRFDKPKKALLHRGYVHGAPAL
uniref:Zinc finger protein 511 n=1 Tax=Sphenodon punctatus TaxID=8508 RepID=A0A8D0G256_SPHPU